ncbi:MAG: hypothetical protein D6760_08050 [Deltaproteobacteria bacterium]|nr:MAG: hypothetical protein D6760_08050 [Deltaproteobacteria bacterium]
MRCCAGKHALLLQAGMPHGVCASRRLRCSRAMTAALGRWTAGRDRLVRLTVERPAIKSLQRAL